MTQKQVILLRMLVFLPITFIAAWLKFPSIIVFIASGLAIVPLAAFIAESTEAIAVLITNSISTDGQSNWLEGALLLITYAVVGTAFYFHP